LLSFRLEVESFLHFLPNVTLTNATVYDLTPNATANPTPVSWPLVSVSKGLEVLSVSLTAQSDVDSQFIMFESALPSAETSDPGENYLFFWGEFVCSSTRKTKALYTVAIRGGSTVQISNGGTVFSGLISPSCFPSLSSSSSLCRFCSRWNVSCVVCERSF
jgi:hypothetical protein